jgi:hypothetical protein
MSVLILIGTLYLIATGYVVYCFHRAFKPTFTESLLMAAFWPYYLFIAK